MKKKFDFTAEMAEAEAIKSNPKNEYLEKENRLFDLNIKELASLNDNVYKLRANLAELVDSLDKYKLSISQDSQEQAEKFGGAVLGRFVNQIDAKCKEAGQRIAKVGNYISIPYKAFYILIVILVALSSFFASMIVTNAEILHSGLIWKAVAICVLIAILGIVMVIVMPKILDRRK